MDTKNNPPMAEEAEVCTKVSEAVKIAGFLDKKGSMLWKRYWFVLEERLLLYYRSQLEYLNLSPCRGSVNMSLVSSVQPRRNSRDPVIHIVSRSNTLILKARDRDTQAKWMQSLLESMGRGPSPFRLSLDNIPAQMNSLPRCRHTGSLDVVWKQGVNAAEPALGSDLGAVEKKACDAKHSTIGRIRSALGRKPSTEADSRPFPKRHRESFLQKIIKRSKVKSERDTKDSESEDDPFYDTIGSGQASPKAFHEILPGGALEELKERLETRKAYAEASAADPPELPPRCPTSSTTILNEDSEDSDLSDHYMVIGRSRPVPKLSDNLDNNISTNLCDNVTNIEVHHTNIEENSEIDINALYSKPKAKTKFLREEPASKYCTPSPSGETIQSQQDESDNNQNSALKSADEIKESLYELTKEGIEMLIKELKDIENERNKAEKERSLSSESQDTETRDEDFSYDNSQHSQDTLVIEIKQPEKEAVEEEVNEIHETLLDIKGSIQDLQNPEVTEDVGAVVKGLSDLNDLLKKLSNITSAPLEPTTHNKEDNEEERIFIDMDQETIPETISLSLEPDYDVPRPHRAIAEIISSEVGSQSDDEEILSFDSASESVEPDSLESKKEIFECPIDELRT